MGHADASDARLYLEALQAVAGPAAGGSPGLLRANVPVAELFHLGGVTPERAQDVARALERVGKIQRRYILWAAARVRSVSPDAARARDLGRTASTVHAVLLAHAPRHAPQHAPRDGVPEGLGDAAVLSLPDVAREAGVSPASVQVALSRLAGAGLADVSPARGVESDVLIKPGPLSAEEARLLSGVLDARRRAARSHLDAIGRYANLTTCRREHLLSHFGDSSALRAAPCGGCDVCDSRPGLGARPSLGRRALAALAAVFGTTRS